MKEFERKSNEDKSRMMLKEPMATLIPKMAIPTIVAFIINAIYSLADTFFVSSLGTNATAAVSVNTSLDQMIFMMGSLFAVGGNSFIARLLGSNDKEKAERVLSAAFFTAIGCGILMMIGGKIFMVPLVRLLGATPTCEQYSIDYATYVLYAAPFMAGNFVMNQCLRSEGSALFSMMGMGFGGILNCFLDPLFIFTLDLGVAGASIATAISKLVSFGILIYPYLSGKTILKIRISQYKPSAEIFREIAAVGSSSFFRNLLAVVAAILLNKEAGTISDSVLAGIGVTTKVMMFPFNIILGFGNGFQPVAGFNWGAQRYDRVKESYYFSTKVAVVGTLFLSAVIVLFAPQIIRAFAGTDPEMTAIGQLSIRLQCLALPIHAWTMVVNMLCAALGRARSAFLISITRQGICFIPILYPMTRLFGAVGVASVQALADVLSLGFAVPIFIMTMKEINHRHKLAKLGTF